jgi:hypothetical protein
VRVAGLSLGGPQREAVGPHDGLDVAAGPAVLPGVPGIDLLALHAGHLLRGAVRAEQLPVQDQEGDAFGVCPLQCLVQVRGLRGEYLGVLGDVPVGGRAGDAVVTAELVDPGAVTESAQGRGWPAGGRPVPGSQPRCPAAAAPRSAGG